MNVEIQLARTEDLTPDELVALREVCDRAFGERGNPRASRGPGFTDDDWANACGGVHVVALEDGVAVAHATVVERDLHVGSVPIPSSYVEAVATRPDRQHRGLGTAVMRAASEHIRGTFALGALDTSRHGFYERLGWERWRGPTFVWTGDGLLPTPKEDGYVMILRTPSTPAIDLGAPISCEWRPGDVW